MDPSLDTSVRRITRTSSAAFFCALGGVGGSIAIVVGLVFVAATNEGPWLTPEGTIRPMAEVYAFIVQLSVMPLVITLPVWGWVVWWWRSVLRDCHEVDGYIDGIDRPKSDLWVVRFRYPNGDTESTGRANVVPTPWVKALPDRGRCAVLVSTRHPRRALPKAFFLRERPDPPHSRRSR